MRRAVGLSLACLLSGCAIGPNFHRPTLPGHPAYQNGAVPGDVHASAGAGAAGQAQRLVSGADVPGDWWKLFQVPELDALVARALAGSPSLQAAQATLKASWEQTKVQGAPLLPSISAEFNPTRNKTSRAFSAVPGSNAYLYNIHTLQLNISYQPDLWGGLRRQIESAAAQAEMQRFQLEATTNTLINTLVLAVIQQASVQAQIEATRQIIDSQQHVLQVMETQQRLGDISLANVMAQRAALTQIEATLPPLMQQKAQAHDQIAVLVGTTPDATLPEPKLEAFRLPSALPVSLPAALLEQRPDIRAAEAQMHSASAQVGVAIANRLPNVQLSATPGQAVNAMSQFFTPGYGNWTIGAMVMQPIFQGFELLHLEREARANLLAATAQYRSTVLGAIQNVADTMQALQNDADALSISAQNDMAAEKSLTISRGQLSAGDISPLLLRSAQQLQMQARLTLIQTQASRFSDSVALFQALGGGWWHRNDSGMRNPPADWKAAFTAPG
ncbi:outer membrane channel lipoprotein [Neoasaia chiangmaiensis NBRC 101099]|uniref:Histidine kinase n=1 Tax=Neoasaia chiangmaiensis TaxID=320497 RepID=A0A1U9KPR4_9PROT|nr:efflux transporter outer membrane subunit [Neoasaia chiangmaiensis]AQS87787.1 histidine kinase [Neoasaia chiangmaiensis]GBR41550.1 outer membrane channel lipoprotein [Neoasaia chiangmaiensis NBRC 101099]GEN14394.1 histidine kinase [Neoasaia chiangmaiensis]